MLERGQPVHRPWVMWWVLCVMLLGGLAPTVSRTLAWMDAGPGFEICTAQSSADDGPAPLPTLEHCPFCLQATDRSAAPPPHQPYLFLARVGTQVRPVPQAFFFVTNPLRPPPARGPPGTA